MGTHVHADGVRKMQQNAAKTTVRHHKGAHRNNVQISVCEPRRDENRPRDRPSRRKYEFFQKHPKTDAEYVSTVEPRRYGHVPEIISQESP